MAEVLLDKTHGIRTVINKTNTVGTESEFRTFQYEVLAGPDDLNVKLAENNCVFEFDYAKVYWNSKLEPEHTRLIKMFQPGEVVCDVMAGIGPFALPAGKKGVFVWANDMNPESYAALESGIKKNKASGPCDVLGPASITNTRLGSRVCTSIQQRWSGFHPRGCGFRSPCFEEWRSGGGQGEAASKGETPCITSRAQAHPRPAYHIPLRHEPPSIGNYLLEALPGSLQWTGRPLRTTHERQITNDTRPLLRGQVGQRDTYCRHMRENHRRARISRQARRPGERG